LQSIELGVIGGGRFVDHVRRGREHGIRHQEHGERRRAGEGEPETRRGA
jgi:hypothetical protein